MKVNIQADIKEFTRKWNRTRKKEIPSIIRNTLNDLARASRIELQKTLPKYIDRPTKFTISSILFEETDKEKLKSMVGFLSKNFPKKGRRGNVGTFPAEYMNFQVHGGTRLPKKTFIAVPTKHYKTNKFGNIKRNDISKLLANPKYFSGTSKKGNPGIFKKEKKGVKMVIAWEKQTEYRGGRYPFRSIVRNFVNSNFRRSFEKNFNQVFKRKGI
tara:strand:+ start:1391 stop:2032 length:642 start_codon:yes stop_codon:yes gene_type:complete